MKKIIIFSFTALFICSCLTKIKLDEFDKIIIHKNKIIKEENNISSAIDYLNVQIENSQKQKKHELVINLYFELANIYKKDFNTLKVEEIYNNIIQYEKNFLKSNENTINCFFLLGKYFYSIEKYTPSLNYFNECLKIRLEKNEYDKTYLYLLERIFNCYYNNNEKEKALDTATKIDNIYSQFKEKNEWMFDNKIRIALLNFQLKKFSEMKFFLIEACNIGKNGFTIKMSDEKIIFEKKIVDFLINEINEATTIEKINLLAKKHGKNFMFNFQ